MTLIPRVVRNRWSKNADDGVHEKFVDYEEHLVDDVGFAGELREHESISSATFDDTSGVTLGTPAVNTAGDGVSFAHEGTGSTVLEVVCDFVAYLASLITLYADASYSVVVSTVGGVGGAAGTACLVDFGSLPGPVDVTGLDNKYVRATLGSGASVRMGPLIWNALGYYNATLVDDLVAADDGDTGTSVQVADATEDFDTYDAHASLLTEPTRKLRVPLRFIDPNREEDDYT